MKNTLLLCSLLITGIACSQEYGTGNVIPEYGKTFTVPSPGFKTYTSSKLKMVLDIDRSFDPEQPNRLIETAARFLNMHEKAGVDPKNMEVALVLHGNAVFDVLEDEFYAEKFPNTKANPNLPLIKALAEKGVQIILCGQSAAHHKVTKEKASKPVKFALSAMTALVQLQNEDYRLVKF
ncbi:DsrE family protein [Gramella sp. GC03-9]|uniref:DsrE family protein n=1 Tax=Christiangramia oceanisediminis TaxID=2920386 RepID=A0A9X2KZK6_9FLAO|nr:DsrE family protein [Gramella oceanisediminis]MCP9201124.1 DsrE family protein [Gramella oceanisediminis]